VAQALHDMADPSFWELREPDYEKDNFISTCIFMCKEFRCYPSLSEEELKDYCTKKYLRQCKGIL